MTEKPVEISILQLDLSYGIAKKQSTLELFLYLLMILIYWKALIRTIYDNGVRDLFFPPTTIVINCIN